MALPNDTAVTWLNRYCLHIEAFGDFCRTAVVENGALSDEGDRDVGIADFDRIQFPTGRDARGFNALNELLIVAASWV